MGGGPSGACVVGAKVDGDNVGVKGEFVFENLSLSDNDGLGLGLVVSVAIGGCWVGWAVMRAFVGVIVGRFEREIGFFVGKDVGGCVGLFVGFVSVSDSPSFSRFCFAGLD